MLADLTQKCNRINEKILKLKNLRFKLFYFLIFIYPLSKVNVHPTMSERLNELRRNYLDSEILNNNQLIIEMQGSIAYLSTQKQPSRNQFGDNRVF